MKEKRSYLGGLMHGIYTLLTGMKITGREFFTKKVTEQYPENRDTLEISPRFRGKLIMPSDAEGNHKCIACGLCQMACPNDTIHITSETITDEETGKKKKKLVKIFLYRQVILIMYQSIVPTKLFLRKRNLKRKLRKLI